MSNYTKKQMEYIDSVDGQAHMSAVKIIGDLEAELEWIDVDDDRKPVRETSAEDNTEYADYSFDVFVCGHKSNGDVRFETGWYDFRDNEWKSDSSEITVTHWKPITLPDEEQE